MGGGGGERESTGKTVYKMALGGDGGVGGVCVHLRTCTCQNSTFSPGSFTNPNTAGGVSGGGGGGAIV